MGNGVRVLQKILSAAILPTAIYCSMASAQNVAPENPANHTPTLDTVTAFALRLSPFGATATYNLDRYGADSKFSLFSPIFLKEKGDGGKDNGSEGTGCGGPDPAKADPIVLSTGNLVESEIDFSSEGEMGLFLRRQYSSIGIGGMFGPNWVTTFDRRLLFYYFEKWFCSPTTGVNCDSAATPQNVWALRPDGRSVLMVKYEGGYKPGNANSKARLVLGVNGLATLYTEENTVETYLWGRLQSVVDSHGIGWTFSYGSYGGTAGNRLEQVTHTNGRQVSFTWSGRQVVAITDTAGNQYQYGYASATFGADLTSVILPGNPTTTITYAYNPGTKQLAARYINGALSSSFAYDTAGHAVMSERAGSVERHEFVYTTDAAGNITQVVETNPLGKRTTYAFANHRLTSITGDASPNCPSSYKERVYDANGFESYVTDFENRITRYTYAPSGQLLQQIEADGTSQARTTNITWDPVVNRRASTAVVGQVGVDFTYTADNRLATIATKNLSASVPASQNQVRITSYAYTKHPNGMLASMTADGPITGTSDAITSIYDTNGDLIEITNSLGHKTTYSMYSGLGLPGKIVGPNGETTEYLYDARGRMVASKQIVSGVAQSTLYAYDGVGRLSTVQTPDGRISYREYDAAGRLALIYEPVSSGLFDVTRYTYNNASLVTSAITQRTPHLHRPVSAPTLTLPAIGPNGIYNVSWTATSSTESYTLEESSNGGSSWSAAYTGVDLNKSFTGKPAGTYTYRISACNAGGCNTSAAFSVQALYTPTLSAPTNTTTDTYTISWNAVTLATKYQLEERFNGGAWALIQDTVATSKAVIDKVNGTYSYQVRACTASGCGNYSAIGNTVVAIAPPSAPTNFSYVASYNPPPYTTTWLFTWSTSVGAKRYELSDGIAGGNPYPASNQIVRDGPPGGATFSIRACNGGGCSSWITTPPSLVPALTAPVSSDNGSYSISWTGVVTAATYLLEESINGGAWSAIQNTSATNRSITGRTPGSYRYRVQACNSGGCGPQSATATTVVNQAPAVPTNFTASFVTTQFPPIKTTFTISWAVVPGATSYELLKITTTTTGIYAGSNAGYSYNNGFGGPMDNGVMPKFSVRACNASGCSAWTAQITPSG